MGTIGAPNIAQWQLDEYRQASELQNQRQQLAQNQALQNQQIAASKQSMEQQAALAPAAVQQGQQNVQATTLENQQKQFAIQHQKVLTDIQQKHVTRDETGKPTGIDYDGVVSDAGAAGIPPDEIAKIQTVQNGLKEQAQKLSDQQAAAHEKENKRIYEITQGLAEFPEGTPERDKAYQAALMAEGSKGAKAIEHWPTKTPTDADLGMWDAQLGMHGQALADAKTKAETKHALMGSPEQAIMNDWISKHPGKGPAEFNVANKALAPTINYNLQAQGVPAGGAAKVASQGETSPGKLQEAIPANIKPTVMAVVEGRMTAPTGFALKSPYWQNVMNQVYAIDPQFNEQRAQLRKAYTLGPQSKEINAINTVIDHVGVMNDAVDALNNSDVKALNAIANKFGVETGSSAPAVFKTIVHRVGPELSKAYLGSGGSAGERGADENDFNVNLAPGILKDNANVTLHLLNSKIGALRNQWDENAAPGVQSFDERFLTKNAKSALAKVGAGGSSKGHVIKIGNDRYQYKGSGPTEDLANYDKL